MQTSMKSLIIYLFSLSLIWVSIMINKSLGQRSHMVHSLGDTNRCYKNDKYPFQPMSSVDIIFYQLAIETNDTNITTITSREDHQEASLKSTFVESEIDHHIQLEGDRRFSFNLLASNRIGLFRPLPDTRHKLCSADLRKDDVSDHSKLHDDNNDQNMSKFPRAYSSDVRPDTSIIICYFNEAPSALIRTIYTVLKRSPRHLVREIIVIDDFSDNEYHSDRIKPFVDRFEMVKYHRTDRREGLIRARIIGSKLAKAEILVFLDSHVEANEGWLEPLVAQIELDRTTVACPMIDLINPETMVYTSSPMVVGGLYWNLHFKWISVSTEKLKTYEDFIKPHESPTMAGGLYAIDREFFHHLGGYDPGMELWGGENVEMSFRVWLCGGKIVVLSCSRVGHIFRKKRPYGPPPDKPDCLTHNSHRAARVWLGDYIDKYYEAVPDAKFLDSGDITERVKLKNNLGCKNFDWYVNKVYPTLKGL